jgi:hypothetical protein
MSEHSTEAERVDESVFGGGAESSIEADIAASGTDGGDAGVGANADGAAAEDVTDSHAADVAAGFDDSGDAPVAPGSEEDGTL